MLTKCGEMENIIMEVKRSIKNKVVYLVSNGRKSINPEYVAEERVGRTLALSTL